MLSSHPTRDVWVEIDGTCNPAGPKHVTSHTGCVSRNWKLGDKQFIDYASHPTRDVWVEISTSCRTLIGIMSHPTRDVWVEIKKQAWTVPLKSVTSHTGCVSRNLLAHWLSSCGCSVTSHTGCVSRNHTRRWNCDTYFVTSHTGCVSRNLDLIQLYTIVTVTSHTGCVSRNVCMVIQRIFDSRHIPHGMCE